jgi:hypothetical protein
VIAKRPLPIVIETGFGTICGIGGVACACARLASEAELAAMAGPAPALTPVTASVAAAVRPTMKAARNRRRRAGVWILMSVTFTAGKRGEMD